MGDRIIATAGKLLIHALHALLVCWKRMLRLGLSVGALSGMVALVFGTLVTHSFPPAPLTWVAALFFGVALGYAAAMTVLADEMLLSIFDAIRVLEGDVKAGLRTAAVAAEREAGEAGRGVMRFLGHARPDQPRNDAGGSGRHAARVRMAPERAPHSQPLVTVSSLRAHEPGSNQADETLAAIAATDAFLTTAPRPSVHARPVRADQLPRIGWASDEAEAQRGRAAATPVTQATQVATAEAIPFGAPALEEMPPLPIRT
ncbi:MAG: hypothetical protein ACRDHP_10170, partial [Ktedonobacterales bacterium]